MAASGERMHMFENLTGNQRKRLLRQECRAPAAFVLAQPIPRDERIDERLEAQRSDLAVPRRLEGVQAVEFLEAKAPDGQPLLLPEGEQG
eukprot:CAMPEP_0179180002 /NCGR_PEP_ID=MMETSP0796-20121207/89094_1 /TAXON_ID=73915 /ORGANISM="Pyrodinium bahamense, Strain pbaha01" /LENGTH=89 /DNA_ID=CAMNT_0020883677 /DNA_START=59 /DNA_END=324 /DNA_ORIENTATION=-